MPQRRREDREESGARAALFCLPERAPNVTRLTIILCRAQKLSHDPEDGHGPEAEDMETWVRVEPRSRYFLPMTWVSPAVLTCDDGVFWSVEHAPHPPHVS